MAVNDVSDPEILELMKQVEEYRLVANFGPEKVDSERVKLLYKKDSDFTAYDPAPPVGGFIGWDDYWVAYHQIFDKYSVCKFEFNDDLRMFRRGETAWCSVSARIFGTSRDGADFHKDVRGSLVWVKEADRWLVTHEHWSAPRETLLTSGEMV